MNYSTEQLSAINSKASQIICLASPGSGKTRTLVARIERMIKDGANPRDITAITYTVAAATELQSRLTVKPGFVGTLHAFCIRLIKIHHDLVKLPEDITVMDDEAREQTIEQIAKEMNCRASLKALKELLEESAYIDPKKGARYTPDELVAIEYHKQMRRNGVLDFNTILWFGLKIAKLTSGDIPVIGLNEWFFRHLFVDEIQDSSNIDMEIYLALLTANKFMVGDTDQAIYSFRGGNVNNAVRLAEPAGDPAFHTWELHVLSTNYRSGSVICHHAQRLIDHNTNRVEKTMRAASAGGAVELWTCVNPADEMARLLTDIGQMGRASEISPSVAVLCRTNRQVDEIALYLQSLGIEVAKREQTVVPEDWRLCKLFLALMANPFNDFVACQFVALRDGQEKMQDVRAQCARKMVSINEAYLGFATGITMPNFSLAAFSPESRARVHEATRILSGFGEWTLAELVSHLNTDERKPELGAGVVVTTLHSSKGREFSVTYICGFEQEIIPGKRSDVDFEEERRLAFVGMTRAKQRLVISWCKNRPAAFTHKLEECHPSQFISECGLTP